MFLSSRYPFLLPLRHCPHQEWETRGRPLPRQSQRDPSSEADLDTDDGQVLDEHHHQQQDVQQPNRARLWLPEWRGDDWWRGMSYQRAHGTCVNQYLVYHRFRFRPYKTFGLSSRRLMPSIYWSLVSKWALKSWIKMCPILNLGKSRKRIIWRSLLTIFVGYIFDAGCINSKKC